jgi:23S rRNA pseudouridine1911/1915/1917 synthase
MFAVKKPAHRVAVGDRVSFNAGTVKKKTSASAIDASDMKLVVLYEDRFCMVINKPRGISVHPAPSMQRGTTTILNGVRAMFAKRSLPFSASDVLVHRLDKETTGCLLLAKTPDAHVMLQRQFAERTVEKKYLALVSGIPPSPRGLIDSPIGRHRSDRTKMAVQSAGRTRAAQTSFEILSTAGDMALLLCTLHTGRTHQIRVHLAAIGHPVLGDPTYHSTGSTKIADLHDITVLCLHAWKLSFDAGKRVSLTAPLPFDFKKILVSCALLSKELN